MNALCSEFKLMFLPFLFQYCVWNTLWLGWNIFAICFYLDVGILDKVSPFFLSVIGWLISFVDCTSNLFNASSTCQFIRGLNTFGTREITEQRPSELRYGQFLLVAGKRSRMQNCKRNNRAGDLPTRPAQQRHGLRPQLRSYRSYARVHAMYLRGKRNEFDDRMNRLFWKMLFIQNSCFSWWRSSVEYAWAEFFSKRTIAVSIMRLCDFFSIIS